MKIDFSNVQSGFELMPEGTYEAALTGFNIAPSKSSGQPTVTLEFTVQEGDYTGRKLWQAHSLQPHALFALKRTLIALGVPEDELEGAIEVEDTLEQLTGEMVRLDVGHRTYEGETYSNITKIRALSVA